MRVSSTTLLYPSFKNKLLEGLNRANEAGIPLRLFETYREPKRQEVLYAKGRTTPGKIITNAKPLRSYHQYGLAADLVLWEDGAWSWSKEHLYRKAGPIFEKLGLVWLGRNTSDLVHYQLDLPLGLDQLEDLYKAKGFEGVWLYLESQGI